MLKHIASNVLRTMRIGDNWLWHLFEKFGLHLLTQKDNEIYEQPLADQHEGCCGERGSETPAYLTSFL